MVIYRHPDPTEPLRKIVLYDGIYVQPQGAATIQAIRGFFQSSDSGAKMTHIVGSGANDSTERVWFDNNLGQRTLVETNPFSAGNNAGLGSRVVSQDLHLTSMPGKDFLGGYGEEVSTTVDHGSSTPYECLSWAAIIFSTK